MATPYALIPHFSLDFLVYLLVFSVFTMADSARPRYTSIISFGDSMTDTGNALIAEPELNQVFGKLPYGRTYFGRPTGRQSDGRLVVDFIAHAFGLPPPPPYLGGRSQDFRHGVNFAVGGATALDAPLIPGEGIKQGYLNYSLSVQLKWFEELKPSLCHSLKDCRTYFDRTLFLVGEFGINDYGNEFLDNVEINKLLPRIPSVVEAISSATERLIEHGAVELLVPGSTAIGCMPVCLTSGASADKTDYDPRNQCLKAINDFSEFHNALLRRALSRLQKKYPEVRITYADYYGPTLAFANFPQRFGFSNGALRSCCGGGGRYNFNWSAWCGKPGSEVHGDPSTFVSWDGVHMTDAAHRILAGTLIKQLADLPPWRPKA
ncbi:unnamed protein product [Spirodela intermedia]|uniref:Uncharacterized protein n=1 Tax=Spirodela intermedia TaxID=51605 RepID=A0A7I8KXS9_SPIIN|nr:unnamed protein product [Spirodela intermedia]